jgi:CHAD domain-containing protein
MSKTAANPTTERRAGSAGGVILAALGAETTRLAATEPGVRADAADAVHQMRVSARTMRSLLGTYRPLLERAPVDRIRDELRWLGGVLSPARDAEVTAELLRRDLAALPARKVRGPVVARLVDPQRAEYSGAHAVAVAALDSARWADLRVRLSALLTDPPLRPRAERPADKAVVALLDKDFRRLRRMIGIAEQADGADREAALHEVRKGAKRLRYAAEAAVPVLGGRAKAVAVQAKKLQGLLGDHRDAVEAAHLVELAAAAAQAAGEDQFTYRLLSKTQAAAAATALRKYTAAVAELRAPS